MLQHKVCHDRQRMVVDKQFEGSSFNGSRTLPFGKPSLPKADDAHLISIQTECMSTSL